MAGLQQWSKMRLNFTLCEVIKCKAKFSPFYELRRLVPFGLQQHETVHTRVIAVT